MGTLRARIEALEKLVPPAPDMFAEAKARALTQISIEQLDLLTIVVTAWEEQQHGPFTGAETAALQAYETALEREIQSKGFRTLHQFLRWHRKREHARI